MPQLWVRRCSKCLTIDLREVWDNPADAHTLPVVPRWARPFYGSRFRWTCPTCGNHEFMVVPHDPDARR
jgi:hypothetical protein